MFLSRLLLSRLLLQKEQKYLLGLTFFNYYSTKPCKDKMEEVPKSNENGESKPLEQNDIEDKPEWYEAHKIAIQNDQQFYTDPVTGYMVMTELFHKSRGYCCGNKCRHCPFNHENVGKNIDLKALANKGSERIDVEKKEDKDDEKK